MLGINSNYVFSVELGGTGHINLLADGLGQTEVQVQLQLTVDPPAVLVCVNRTTSIHASLNPTAPLSVNLLSSHQRDVSAAFGGGMTENLFGAQTSNVLQTITRWLGAIFFGLTLFDQS